MLDRTIDTVEDSRNDATNVSSGDMTDEKIIFTTKRKLELDATDYKQTKAKRARLDVEATFDADLITALYDNIAYDTHYHNSEEPSFKFNALTQTGEQTETSTPPVILYASKKSIGTKRKSTEDIRKKVKEIGKILDNLTTLQIRTVYWILVALPNCSLKIQPESNPVKIEKIDLLENSTLFQIHTPKHKGQRYFEFTSGNIVYGLIIQVSVLPESNNNSPRLLAPPSEISSAQFDNTDPPNLAQPTPQYDNTATPNLTTFQANIVSFDQEHFQVLRTVLEQLQFTQEVVSKNIQLWRRRTIHEWNVLIYMEFGLETLISLREHLSLVDGALIILPKQNARNYEVSDIEFSDGNKLTLLTTIGTSESVHIKTLSPNVQAVVTMVKNENQPIKSFEVSAAHQGSSSEDLALYVAYWLSIGLKPRLGTRPSLFTCFLYEKDVMALTEYARHLLQSLGVSVAMYASG